MATSSSKGYATLERVNAELARSLPNVYGVLRSQGEREFVSLYVKARGENEVVVILKARGEKDASDMVAFGNGFDVTGALLALNASLAGGKWVADKYAGTSRKPQWTQDSLPL